MWFSTIEHEKKPLHVKRLKLCMMVSGGQPKQNKHRWLAKDISMSTWYFAAVWDSEIIG